MTRERVAKPIAPLQRAPDAAPKARASSRPASLARLPITLEAKPVSPAQLEIQRAQALEVQRLSDLEVQRAAIQRAHDDRFTTARASQTEWHAQGTKTIGVQRAVAEHARTARDASHTRAAFVAKRQPALLETLVAQRLEAEVCPALLVVQRQADLTLSHVADHYGSKAAVQLAQDPERLSSYAGFKNTGAGLVKNFRAPGSSHTMPELASAVQRFRDPMQRAAVESAAYAAFGSHPTYPKQLQRALEEQDSSLEVRREAWQRELEPIAQRQALEEASGEKAAGMIEAARGGGQPLPENVRNMLETKWNTDLSKVRVHTDSSAASISKKLNAKALTTGQDIFFGTSTFNPTSLEGLQLIAHETWHTVQQAGGLVQAGVDRDKGLELEAQGKGSEVSSNDLQAAVHVERQPGRANKARSLPSGSKPVGSASRKKSRQAAGEGVGGAAARPSRSLPAASQSTVSQPSSSGLTVQRAAAQAQQPVTLEQAKAAGQRLIGMVRQSATTQTGAVTALAAQHASQIKAQGDSAAQTIRQTSSGRRRAVKATFQQGRSATASHASAAKSEVQGAVQTQQGALSGKTQAALAIAQQHVKTGQSATTQLAAQQTSALTAESQQRQSATDQKFQTTSQTARQTGGQGGSSSVAPEVGAAKTSAGQQMGQDAAKDVDTAKNQTRVNLQQKAGQAAATMRQKGARAAKQVGSLLPSAQNALRAQGAAGKQRLSQIASQTATALTSNTAAVSTRFKQGEQRVDQRLEQLEKQHAARAQKSGQQAATSLQLQATKTNARTMAAVAQFEAKVRPGVNPNAVDGVAANVTARLGAARAKTQSGVVSVGARTASALRRGAEEARHGLTQTSSHAATTTQSTVQGFKRHTETVKGKVIPAAAQLAASTAQAHDQTNASTARHLTTMTAGHQKNFSAGRERIVAALGKDGESASSRANSKVSGELNAKVTAAHGKIETKALQEKSNLERQANSKDGQARLEATKTGAKQRNPIQRWAWLDNVFEWFGKQWDKIKSTFTSPSFWAGLIVGLVVAIAIVAAVAAIIATGGAAAGVLLALGPLLLPVIGGVAGAAAGFAGTVASNVTHNAVGEKNADGTFTQRGVFEGAGRNTALGLGAGVALAYAPASLPWLIGGGAALNVGVGAYDNVQNDKPWYDSLGADAVIGGVTALIGFGAFKGFAGAARGTRVDPANIPQNANARNAARETLNKPQQLRDTYASELKNPELSKRLTDIERIPNPNERGERLNRFEQEIKQIRDQQIQQKLQSGAETIALYTVGELPPIGPARWKFLENPSNWTPERQALHNVLIKKASADAQAFANAAQSSEPTIFAMRGNTAAGKSRAIKGNIAELESPINATKDLRHRAVNPDNFKVDLAEAATGVKPTSSQTHSESSMLASRLEIELRNLKVADGTDIGSILIDKRLATMSEVEKYALMARETGRKLNVYDVDAPLEVSLAGVLERVPGGNDPLPPYDVVADGFRAVRSERADVIEFFENNPRLGSYELYATKPNGDKVKVAEVGNGSKIILDEVLFREVTAQPGQIPELVGNLKITQQLIDQLTSNLPPQRAQTVRQVLEPYKGKTWREAVDGHSKGK